MKLPIRLACLALLGMMTFGFTNHAPAEEAGPALVLNYGQGGDGSFICFVSGGGIFAVGKLTAVLNDGGQSTFACNGELFTPAPPRALKGDLTCGPFGVGSYVINPAGRFNGVCH